MSSNFVQFGHQSNLENFLKSTNVEELDDADLMAVNGGYTKIAIEELSDQLLRDNEGHTVDEAAGITFSYLENQRISELLSAEGV